MGQDLSLPAATRAFFASASRGDVAAVTASLASDGSLASTADASGITALVAAAAGGHVPVMDVLLASGADVSAGDPRSGWCALHAAAYGGHVAAFHRALAAGADVTATGAASGLTVVHRSVLSRSGVMVAAALEACAGTGLASAGDQHGDTPLHLAAQLAWAEGAVALLAAGASTEAVNAAGLRPQDVVGLGGLVDEAQRAAMHAVIAAAGDGVGAVAAGGAGATGGAGGTGGA